MVYHDPIYVIYTLASQPSYGYAAVFEYRSF